MSKQNKTKKPKSKNVFVDDGRTVYDMSNTPKAFYKVDKQTPTVDKKEKRALIKAAFAAYLPVFLSVVACFSAVALLLYFWLK